LRGLVGLSGQYAAVDELLTGRENLWMFGRLYRLPSDQAKRRADELLATFDLTDAADRILKTYSGGVRRRLDLAGSLIAHPTVLFLDELKAKVGGERIEVVVHDPPDLTRALELLTSALGIADSEASSLEEHTRRITVPAPGGSSALVEVIRTLDAAEIRIADIGLRRPTLDDVFLTLTGHEAEQKESL
jgi:ABC-type iron transport system FetAB ATPase subunit